MIPFIETLHCTSRSHCQSCRDRIVGRTFRQSLMKVYTVPESKLDFTCPEGKPWRIAGVLEEEVSEEVRMRHETVAERNRRFKLAQQSPVVAGTQASRLAVCRRCSNYKSDVCKILFPLGCCLSKWRKFLWSSQSTCPNQPPRWTKE